MGHTRKGGQSSDQAIRVGSPTPDPPRGQVIFKTPAGRGSDIPGVTRDEPKRQPASRSQTSHDHYRPTRWSSTLPPTVSPSRWPAGSSAFRSKRSINGAKIPCRNMTGMTHI